MRTYKEEASVDPVDRPTWVDSVDNPYLHGPYTPVVSEITAVDLKVTAGEIPADLCGAYLRNGPNPVLEPKGLYHWFDGDGMVHAVYFRDGRASYIRQWVRHARCTTRSSGARSNCRASWARTTLRRHRDDVHTRRTPITARTRQHHAERGTTASVLSAWYNAGRDYSLDPLTLETEAERDVRAAASTRR